MWVCRPSVIRSVQVPFWKYRAHISLVTTSWLHSDYYLLSVLASGERNQLFLVMPELGGDAL